MEPSIRAREILAAVVKEYIVSGEAVGSRTLVQRYGIHQSAATVRNVMADLEDCGFLRQPHASAGRIPTSTGLRFYVDKLMRARELSEPQRREIVTRYNLTSGELQDLLREASRLLSDLSQHCAVVLAPRTECAVLKRIEFVPISPGRLIAVLVMSSGQVQNRILHLQEDLLPKELERVHNYLNALCVGCELSDVRARVERELAREETTYDSVAKRALELGAEALGKPAEDELLVEGQASLLDHPEFDRDEVKALVRGIEQKRLVLRLLDETMSGQGVHVFIGAETKEQEMRNCAVIAAAYGGEQPLGTLGVIGPSNIDYPHVIPLVDFTATLLTEVLSK